MNTTGQGTTTTSSELSELKVNPRCSEHYGLTVGTDNTPLVPYSRADSVLCASLSKDVLVEVKK